MKQQITCISYEQVSLHLYLNNPGGYLKAALFDERVGSEKQKQKPPLPGIQGHTGHGEDEKKAEDRNVGLNQALGFCWSLSLTPDSKITQKKVAALELNRRLKDLPCLSEVTSSIEAPDLLLSQSSFQSEQTDELQDNGYGPFFSLFVHVAIICFCPILITMFPRRLSESNSWQRVCLSVTSPIRRANWVVVCSD